MTPFWSFIIGAVGIGIILSIIFGILFMEGTDEAYRKGFNAGLGNMEVEDDLD